MIIFLLFLIHFVMYFTNFCFIDAQPHQAPPEYPLTGDVRFSWVRMNSLLQNWVLGSDVLGCSLFKWMCLWFCVIWNQLEHTPFNNGSGPALAKERKRKCLIWVLAWVGSSPLNIFPWWIEWFSLYCMSVCLQVWFIVIFW